MNGVTDAVLVSAIDSITFDPQQRSMLLAANGGVFTSSVDELVELTYGEMPAACSVVYAGNSATIVNPYYTQGVTASVDGAHLIINNENAQTECTFELSGETANGSLLYTGAYKTTFVLDGVSIANPKGPAIDIECGKRIALELKKNTVNTLTDGAGGDWKAALYCKGHLEIDKAGTLSVTGNTKHAISSKEYLQLKKAEGTINILGAKGDGIHCGQYFLAGGYNVNIDNVEGDGIQAELSGDEAYAEAIADGSLCIQGGTFRINCTGKGVSALKADADVVINAGKSLPTIDITNAGAPLVEGTDVQTAKCINADGNISILAGTLNLSATGAGGKCIKTDGTFTMGDKTTGEGPTLTTKTTGAKYSTGSTGGTTGGGGRPGGGGGWKPGGGGGETSGSSAKAIKAKGAVNVYGGEMNVSTATDGAEGLESKTSINIAGGRHYLKCYDDCINCSGSISFNGGITVCYSTGNDAVDSNYGRTGAIVIGDGTILTYSTKGGAEMGFDCDGNSFIQIKGNGIAISAGGNQGGSSSSTISGASQGYAFVTTNISYQTGRYYTLADSSGKNLVTYSFEGNLSSSCSMFTAKGMTKGATYNVKYRTQAPTDAETEFHGLYLGSSATGTSSVTSFTAK